METSGQRAFGRFRFAIVSLICAAAVCAATMFARQVLDNEAVLKLVKAGLSGNIILAMVKNQPGNYSVAVDDVIKLKNAGVPDPVVAAMIQKQSGIPAKTGETAIGSHTSWKTIPVPQWSEEDAKQVLADSPWTRNVQLDIVRNLSLFERRDGGDWDADVGTGFGIATAAFLGDSRKAQALEHAHERANPGAVVVRWESASPVRAAQLKTGETSVPGWVGDYYAIAVHNVQRPLRWNLARELKGLAALKRDNKKDLKPLRAVVLPEADGLATLVYLFPRFAAITKVDGSVGFVAQIGRLFVSVNFFTGDMQLQGDLQL